MKLKKYWYDYVFILILFGENWNNLKKNGLYYPRVTVVSYTFLTLRFNNANKSNIDKKCIKYI